jgi:hypothetical protein
VIYSDGHLLFTRDRTLMARAFDITTLAVVGDPFRVIDQVQFSPGAGVGIVAGSHSGALGYGTSTDLSGLQLVWFDQDGKPTATLGDRAEYADVRVSPDGQTVAISRPAVALWE